MIYNAEKKSIEAIRNFITADSLGYISIEGLHKAINLNGGGFCDACFSGDYPVPFPESIREKQMELFLLEVQK